MDMRRTDSFLAICDLRLDGKMIHEQLIRGCPVYTICCNIVSIEWASALVPPTPLSRGGGQADRCRIWSINSSTANTDKHDNVKPPDHQNCQIRAIPFFDSWS